MNRPKGKLSEARLAELRWTDENYYPCACGVHVCGSDDTKNAAITVANIPARNEAEARKIFEACKIAEAISGEPQDLVVDLNLTADNLHVEDFSISRQMLDRCLAAGRAALVQDRE